MPTILVTGASSGIGRAVADRFSRKKWRVIAVARRKERLDQINGVEACILDVRDRKEVFRKFVGLEVDVLLNGAGLSLGTDVAWKCNVDDWEAMVDTNIKGLLYCTHALLPKMIERNKGYIINIGSSVGNYAYRGSGVYGASKAFVNHFTANLRCDLLGTAVRTSCLEPGVVETEFFQVRAKGEKVKMKVKAIQPEEIAAMIDWLVEQPAHVNINSVEVAPIGQAWGNYAK